MSEIIKNMSDDVKAKAEAYAKAKGITLEQAIAEQMETELSDADLDGVAGGRGDLEIEYGSGTEVEYKDIQAV